MHRERERAAQGSAAVDSAQLKGKTEKERAKKKKQKKR